MKLAEQIYTLRVQKNLSQEQLADALGVSRQSVSKWETGASVPELDKLVLLAQLFGVTLDDLVQGEPPVPPAPQTAVPAAPARPLRHWVGAGLLMLAGLAGLLTLLTSSPLFLTVAVMTAASGVLCLRLEKPGLWCAWLWEIAVQWGMGLYTGISLRSTIGFLLGRYQGYGPVLWLGVLYLLLQAVLLVWTVRRLAPQTKLHPCAGLLLCIGLWGLFHLGTVWLWSQYPVWADMPGWAQGLLNLDYAGVVQYILLTGICLFAVQLVQRLRKKP